MVGESLEEGLVSKHSNPETQVDVSNGLNGGGGDSSATPVLVFSTLVAICGSFSAGCGVSH